MSENTNILIPSFERELLRMAGAQDGAPQLLDRLDEQVRLAILFSESAALIPAPGFFETAAGLEVVRRFSESLDRGQLALLGTGGRPQDYTTRKLSHWVGDHQQLDLYGETAERRILVLNGDGWRVKTSSTDVRLLGRWEQAVADGVHPLMAVWRRAGVSASRAERAVAEMPADLEGTAMLVDNITRRLPPRTSARLEQGDIHELRLLLAQGFFDSYLGDAGAVALLDGRFGAQSAAMPDGASALEVRRLRIVLEGLGLEATLLHELDSGTLAALADTAIWQSLRIDLARRAVAPQPYNADELLALRRVRKPKSAGSARRLEQLQLLLSARPTLCACRPRCIRSRAVPGHPQ